MVGGARPSIAACPLNKRHPFRLTSIAAHFEFSMHVALQRPTNASPLPFIQRILSFVPVQHPLATTNVGYTAGLGVVACIDVVRDDVFGNDGIKMVLGTPASSLLLSLMTVDDVLLVVVIVLEACL